MRTNIKLLRLENKLSQKQLANETGVKRGSIAGWEIERHIPNINDIIILSRYFQVTTDYLLCLSDDNSITHRSFNLNVDLSLFANRLRFLRIKNDISQTLLAESIDINQTTISQWEYEIGIPNAQSIVTIAKFFGVTTDYLLGESD